MWCFVAGRTRGSHNHISQLNNVKLMNIFVGYNNILHVLVNAHTYMLHVHVCDANINMYCNTWTWTFLKMSSILILKLICSNGALWISVNRKKKIMRIKQCFASIYLSHFASRYKHLEFSTCSNLQHKKFYTHNIIYMHQ